MAKTQCNGLDQHQKAFIKLVHDNARRHHRHEVFRDFCELAALSISNSVDRAQFQVREARYLDIASRYQREELDRFAQMLAHLVEALEIRPTDVLGQIFMSLDLGDAWKGQFFTPYEVSRMMALMTLTDAASVIEQQGFLLVNEPAAGAGGMLIAVANALLEQGINYQNAMHATAIDIDATACHMTYLQLSLLHVPAIVIHGNALWPDPSAPHWVTPAHVLGFWDIRLRRRQDREDSVQPSHVAEPTTAVNVPGEPLDVQRQSIVTQRLTQQLSLFS